MKKVQALAEKIIRAFGKNHLPFPSDEGIEANDWSASEIVSRTILSNPSLQKDFAITMAGNYINTTDYNTNLVFLGWRDHESENEDLIELKVIVRPFIPNPDSKPLVD